MPLWASFSSSFMVPVNLWGVTAQQQVSGLLQGANSANASVGYDVAIPLTIGIRFSANNNLAISAWVFTPTGLFFECGNRCVDCHA